MVGRRRRGASPLPLEGSGVVTHREAHVARRGRNPEFIEETDEVRVGRRRVDEETGVDRERRTVDGDVDGVGVATEPGRCLVEVNLVVTLQQVRSGQPRDA